MENYTIKYVIAAQIQLLDEYHPKIRTLSDNGRTFTSDKNILLFDTKIDALEKISEMYKDGVVSGIFILEYVTKNYSNN